MILSGTALPSGFQIFSSDSFSIDFHAAFWKFIVLIENGYIDTEFGIIDPLLEVFMWGFQLFFVYCVYRHTQGLWSRRKTILYGVFSHFVFLSLFLMSLPSFIAQGFRGMLYGPVPILLIIGLIISYYYGKETPTTPWD